MNFQLQLPLTFIVAMLLVSCGGGSSSTTPTNPGAILSFTSDGGPFISPPTAIPSGLSVSQSGNGDPVSTTTGFPVRSALATIFKSGTSAPLTLNGSIDQGTGYLVYGNITVTIQPSTSITFNNNLVSSNTITVTGFDSQSGDVPINLAQTQLTNGNLQTLAIDNGAYCPGVFVWAYPSFINVTQTGTLGNYVCYTDFTASKPAGSLDYSYSANIQQDDTLKFEVISTTKDTLRRITSVTSITFSITHQGAAKIVGFSNALSTAKYTYQIYGS